MKRFFWGFLLLFLDIPVAINLSGGIRTVQLLPAWLGFALLVSACRTLRRESPRFDAMGCWCTVLTVYTAVLWLGSLLLPLGQWAFLLRLMALLSGWLTLYVAWLFVAGLGEMERHHNASLGAAFLRRCWAALAVCVVPASVVSTIYFSAVFHLLPLAAAAASLFFVVGVWRTDRPWREVLAFSQGRR